MTETRAAGLCASLSRDPSDFIRRLDDASDEVLTVLLQILTADHPDFSQSDRSLHDLGARIVKAHLRRRGVEVSCV